MPWRGKLSRRSFIYAAAGAGLGLAGLSATSGNAEQRGREQGIPLPAPALAGAMSVEAAIQGRRSERGFVPAPLTMGQLSQLLWAAQGITDPHPDLVHRFLRAAPSAGAQYPLDLYVVAGLVEGLEAGVYHYRPQEHEVVAPNGRSAPALGQSLLGPDVYGAGTSFNRYHRRIWPYHRPVRGAGHQIRPHGGRPCGAKPSPASRSPWVGDGSDRRL